ncbi:DUF3265 domain-containing protein [Vibrio parahaemolyticus]|nr:DUF3265 domain-containing protein [Vibrio parahaemolyticus]MBE4327734.1 DUF3265 domain-containing protein [Vibrio parahaemolyticus]
MFKVVCRSFGIALLTP